MVEAVPMHEAETPASRSLGRVFPIAGRPLQSQADVAVVIPTVMRFSLLQAVRSVFAQRDAGTVQLCIGIDIVVHDSLPLTDLYALLEQRPAHVGALVLDPGWSTARRNGGLHRARDGGALRTTLSLLANAPRIAYLDDDNAWLPDHLASLLAVIEGFGWAYAQRWLVDRETRQPLCVDVWDSIGPWPPRPEGRLPGFVDPSCLMIDKRIAESALSRWTIPLLGPRGGADRRVVQHLLDYHPVAWTGRATVLYGLRPKHILWSLAVRQAAARQGQSVPA